MSGTLQLFLNIKCKQGNDAGVPGSSSSTSAAAAAAPSSAAASGGTGSGAGATPAKGNGKAVAAEESELWAYLQTHHGYPERSVYRISTLIKRRRISSIQVPVPREGG
jgi:hypothetical protein